MHDTHWAFFFLVVSPGILAIPALVTILIGLLRYYCATQDDRQR